MLLWSINYGPVTLFLKTGYLPTNRCLAKQASWKSIPGKSFGLLALTFSCTKTIFFWFVSSSNFCLSLSSIWTRFWDKKVFLTLIGKFQNGPTESKWPPNFPRILSLTISLSFFNVVSNCGNLLHPSRSKNVHLTNRWIIDWISANWDCFSHTSFGLPLIVSTKPAPPSG